MLRFRLNRLKIDSPFCSANWLLLGILAGLVMSCRAPRMGKDAVGKGAPRIFAARGVIREIKPDGRTLIIQHQEITNYMAAMTMPFRVHETNQLSGVKPGDEVAFRLLVTDDESWIDRVTRIGLASAAETIAPAAALTNAPAGFFLLDIPDFALTNEFGQPLSLRGFKGKAVAMTFFFTRCPLPEYCPRLTRNFHGAIEKLKAAPGGPTNFHFLSISFDPIDTPALLRSYARQYRYDSNYWSFVTGNSDQIRELARGFGVSTTPEGGTLNHSFSTAIFDTTGKLQNMWPIGGDMTDQIVGEITRAARTK